MSGAWEETTLILDTTMYKQLTQKEIDLIVAKARAERAGAFGRWVSGIFGR